jgi:hypothetical protein
MKQRSAAYPYYTILESLDFAGKIYKNYGSNYRATREQIAEALGYSVGSLTQKVSAATQYGLLDMKSKEGYMVTPLFVKWYRPINNEAQKEALVESFKNPPLYESLLQVFENNILPPLKPLASILLQKHSISENACDKAAEIFEENAKMIGVLNDNRELSFNNGNIDVIEEIIEEEIEDSNNNQFTNLYSPAIVEKTNKSNSRQNTDQDQNSNNKENDFNNPIPHNIPLKNKLPAQLLLPSDVSSADFDFIISYIGLIRNQY